MTETTVVPHQEKKEPSLEEIAERFKTLVGLRTVHLSPSENDEEKAKKLAKQQELAEYLARVPADRLTEAILKDPPTVNIERTVSVNGSFKTSTIKLNPGKIKISPPSQRNLSYAEKDVKPPDELEDEKLRKVFQVGIQSIQTFLRTPSIIDEFTNHQDRREWELGIKATLNLIDDQRKGPEGADRTSTTFFRVWENNALTKNSRAGAAIGITLLLSALKDNPPSALKDALEKQRSEFVKLGLLNEKIPEGVEELDPSTGISPTSVVESNVAKNKKKVFTLTHKTAIIARNIIDAVSESNNKEQ